MLRVGVCRSKCALFRWAGAAAIGLVAFVLVSATPAATDPNVGYDISYPQCNGTFPSGGAFGIAGVNGGKPYSANPCLGTGDGASELSWAGMNAQLYANTADPGPALSSHWPNGQTSPKQCNTAANPGSETPACHYDYGWNAAADSYQDAVNAYVALGWAAAGANRTPVANSWWLDVETANSWTSTASLNVQALQGEVDYLDSVGAAGVGFYSSTSDWQTITAGTTSFASSPTWLAEASSLSDAQSRCGAAGFTGGGIALVQYPSAGFDADYRCTAQPALSFATSSQTLTAGGSSAPISLQLSQPSGASVTITVTSSSTAGSFSTGASGPWSTSISLPVAAGATTSASFYYTDNRSGSPTLTATAPAYTSSTQTETIRAASLAGITISPASSQVRVGASQAMSAAGKDRYGNTVPVTPSWSVSPPLGTFSPNPAGTTTFSATTVGSGTITATSGGIAGSASVSVARKRHSSTLARTAPTRVRSVQTRPSLHVRPSVVRAGGTVRIFGHSGRCSRGSKVFVLSRALAGHAFAGMGAITTGASAHGTFTVSGRIRPKARPARYVITARCGGVPLHSTASIRVTKPA